MINVKSTFSVNILNYFYHLKRQEVKHHDILYDRISFESRPFPYAVLSEVGS